MRRLWLHVGMSKTGSSSIQSTLAETQALPDLSYLMGRSANPGRELITAFEPEPERKRTNRKRALDGDTLAAQGKRFLKKLDQQIEQAQGSDFVLSSEMICLLSPEGLQGLHDWLSPRFGEIRVLAYVREPVSYIESMYQQSLKGGRAGFDLARRYPAYRERFAPIEAAFGRERVEYRLFASEHLQDGCVVRDFVSWTGRSLPAAEVVRINESLSLPAVGLLYHYRQHGPDFGQGTEAVKANRALIAQLRQLPGPKFRLARSLVQPVIEAQAQDLAWMANRLGLEVPIQYAAPGTPAVDSESSLDQPTPAALAWLAQRTHTPWSTSSPGSAQVVGALEQLRQQAPAAQDEDEDKKLSAPGATVAAAQAPARSLPSPQEIQQAIASTVLDALLHHPGPLTVAGLGSFGAPLPRTEPARRFTPEARRPDPA